MATQSKDLHSRTPIALRPFPSIVIANRSQPRQRRKHRAQLLHTMRFILMLYLYKFLFYDISMPLSIKNDALERLARRLADETGESLTSAILISLEERWERLQH